MRIVKNGECDRRREYGPDLREIVNLSRFLEAQKEISSWPGYTVTPLRNLNGLAARLGVGSLWYKDESDRFGLGSFKALGGAYAVFKVLKRAIEEKTGRGDVGYAELRAGAFRDITSAIAVSCATDGNHGRSVAWGANLFGLDCVIYLHEGVSRARARAIADLGATVIRAGKTYDESVRRAAEDAARLGRTVISDTSYPGYMDIPRDVTQGYTVMVDEALSRMDGKPTHVFIQGGVGALAAAIIGHMWELFGAERPCFVIVEPDRADCIFQSLEAGRPVSDTGTLDTVMAGLACGEVSLLAWEIIAAGADFALTIPDEAALDAMRTLARGEGGDTPLVAGESGVAGLAGLITASTDEIARTLLGLDSSSHVLVFGTEGATDPDIYRQVVGKEPREVEQIRGAEAS